MQRMMMMRAAVVARRGCLSKLPPSLRTTTSTPTKLGYPSSCFSTAAAAAAAPVQFYRNPVSHKLQTQHLYMWGTDSSGSVYKPATMVDEAALDVPADITDWRARLGMQTGDNNNNNDATEASVVVGIRKVVCGPTDTAILLSDGRCFVSGENKQGQLGLGHADKVTTPTELTLPADTAEDMRIVDVALGSLSAAFVDGAGDLHTAGFGGSTIAGHGCLGHGDTVTRHRATLVESLVEDGCRVKQVALGESHMTVLTKEGEVLTVGSGSYGRLGNFDTIDQLYLEPVELLTVESGIIEIAGGKSFTLALSSDGVVYGWGRNHKGQLGTGLGLAVDMYAMQAVPDSINTKELASRHIVKIATGHSHAACISESGELFEWGMAFHLEPVRVDALMHTKIVDVVCGHDYTLAIDEQGHMYSLGKGKTGVLGQGSVRQLKEPAIMEAFQTVDKKGKEDGGSPASSRPTTSSKRKVVQASAGWKHAACLVEEAA